MPNRLAGETSPYLLQHAANPVDWHPWDDEALAVARREGKPILLSIGYSACHWCHVMAHESFEDPAVAAAMNADFVNIKVDREERPDLDQIYQTAHALLTRRSRRLAADDVPDARRRAVLRRHLFPEGRALRSARLPRPSAARGRRVSRARRRHRAAGGRSEGCAREPRARARRRRRPAAERRLPPPRSRSSSVGSTRTTADSARRPSFRTRRISSFASRARADGRRRRARDGAHHARADGRRRHPRSAGRRLLPLQRRCRVDDPAFREDALRQRPAARALRRPRAGDRRRAVRGRRARHRRLDDPGDARAGRRLLLEPRCRQRRRGGQVLRLVADEVRSLLRRTAFRGRCAALSGSTDRRISKATRGTCA